ncbi:glycosyltransferase [Mangrovimicrobium sediminis]|uniref:Glycosyltransferase n=2 Tax=Mangrovimicrobium sediminis TaxID=2562682 RepID=A0A4Z0LUL0_9GAMM|nr:glycosyltransferase [Haliea sp. SAOS-164]
MTVLQVLPGLDSGGVERGTVDLARELVRRGHRSLVMSSGGRLQAQLEAEGSTHITYPVHRKSLASLWRVPGLRRELDELAPDVIHVRSRIPAWMVWLAVGKRPPGQRPALVSTFHGLYSVSRYSAIMGCGDRVIAISDCVRDYITGNYPQVDPARITRIHRGVDTAQFPAGFTPSPEWRDTFFADYPAARDKPLLLMPGRLSRWKGQLEFIELLARLRGANIACHGLVAGEGDPGKEAYREELVARAAELGIAGDLSFLGHRSDMAELYAVASVVCNLSQHAEPFGRTVIEALAVGTPVVAWNEGGPAESLRESLPAGLVTKGDMDALAAAVSGFLAAPPAVSLPASFTLQAQVEATLAVYREAIAAGAAAQSGN